MVIYNEFKYKVFSAQHVTLTKYKLQMQHKEQSSSLTM
jgi:hypothetical protein